MQSDLTQNSSYVIKHRTTRYPVLPDEQHQEQVGIATHLYHTHNGTTMVKKHTRPDLAT
jgi:hypothetical protein